MTERPSWDDYLLGIAEPVAVRGDCLRSCVGAVLVRPDRRIAAAGHNDTPPGGSSYLDSRCVRCRSNSPPGTDYGACIATHAEADCLLHADQADCQDTTAYITRAPCRDCTRLIHCTGTGRAMWPSCATERELC
ncbi:deoxycytidylate deaminase [Streptomyces noursei]|uniref:deoxycytidylate deaminase n=1 Tax=Streptomyces noursei TaxID=1971 RepID=UPI00167BC391